MKSILPAPFATAVTTTADQAQRSRSEAALDSALVHRFVQGDETAFTEIMERHRGKIFAVAMSMLHCHGDAEEVTQDTFIRAYRGLANFRGDSSLATWLYRIAANLARNRYWFCFRRMRQATISLDRPVTLDRDGTFADLIAADVSDPAQESTHAEFVGMVSECLERLAPSHRDILMMRNGQQLSYHEIAAVLGINVGTVKSRIARARDHLRALLAARCPEFGAGDRLDDYFPTPRASGLLNLAAA